MFPAVSRGHPLFLLQNVFRIVIYRKFSAKGCNGNRLRLPSPHRDTLRAALTLALRKYWGFGCSLMHSFCGRIRIDNKKSKNTLLQTYKIPERHRRFPGFISLDLFDLFTWILLRARACCKLHRFWVRDSGRSHSL